MRGTPTAAPSRPLAGRAAALSLLAVPGRSSPRGVSARREGSAPAGPLAGAERVMLENGLTVLLLPEPGTGLVSVGMMYRVGAKNEAAGTTGLAHYAEHMNFRATRRFPGHEITESVTRRGGRWTGYTWIDQTFYQTTFAKDDLDLALDLEADRMGEALYDEKEFAQERTSVVAELRSYDDPHALLYDEVLSAAFLIHPYRNNTIGWLTDVESVSRDAAYRFYRRYYHPRNAVLAIGGDFDRAAALEAVRARFAAKPAGEEDAHVSTVEPPQSGERRLTVRKPGSYAEVLVAFPGPRPGRARLPGPRRLRRASGRRQGPALPHHYEAPRRRSCARRWWRRGRRWARRPAFQASRYPYVYTLKATTSEATGLAAAEQALFAADRRGRDPRVDARPTWRARGARCGRAWPATSTPWPGASTSSRSSRCPAASSTCGTSSPGSRRSRPTPCAASRREWLVPEKATIGWFVPTPGVPVFTGGEAPREGPGRDCLRPLNPQRLPPRRSRPALSPRATGRLRERRGRVPSPSRTACGSWFRPSHARGLVALRGRIEAGTIHETKAGRLRSGRAACSPWPRAAAGGPPLVLSRDDDPAAAGHARFLEFHGERPARGPARAGAGGGPRGSRLIRRRSARPGRRPGTPRPPPWPIPARFSAARARATFFPPSSPLARSPWGDEATLAGVSAADLAAFTRTFLSAGADRAERGGTGRGGGGETGGRGRLRAKRSGR